MQVPFATQSYQARSKPLSAQRLVNLYAEIAPPDSKSFVALYGTPGPKGFSTIGADPVRGVRLMAGLLYVVSGANLYSVSSLGVSTSLGTIPRSDAVTMADSGTELAIAANSKGYVYSIAGGLVTITDPDFPAVSSVDFQDGYFIWSVEDSGQFVISELFAATDYDALDFATAEGNPDNLVRAFVEKRQLFLFGEHTTEIWFNSGDATFPFERIPGGFMERGLLARDSVVREDNSLFWLGDDLVVYRADGLVPVAVSTHAIGKEIRTYANPQNATAFSHTEDGHKFYVLTFDEGAWAYDTSTGLWHERETYGEASYRACCGIRAYGKSLVGDRYTGKLYELDPDTYTDAGGILRSLAVSSPLGNGVDSGVMRNFEIHMEAGTGLTTGQGENPQMMLRFSDDDARTWSTEIWRSLGKIGEHKWQADWNRLGQFKSRVMEISITDPVKRSIIAAHAF